MENVKTNEGELTSTMGNILSASKEEKNDASDSTPTSSTDAFTTTSTSQIAADDPISSTSSDVLDSRKSTEKVNDIAQSSTNNVIITNPIMSSLNESLIGDHSSSIVSEKDLLDMNITDTSTEKITENVDDIVQDLENLLGEPTTSFDFTIRSKDVKRNISSMSENKDISTQLDEFSAELQMLEEKHTNPPAETRQDTFTNANQTVHVPNNLVALVDTPVTDKLPEKSITTYIPQNNVNDSPSKTSSVCNPEVTESTQSDNHNIESSTCNELESDTIERVSDKIEEHCQSEIVTASTILPTAIEKNEVEEIADTTSIHTKLDHVEEQAHEVRNKDIIDNILIVGDNNEIDQVSVTCFQEANQDPNVGKNLTSSEDVAAPIQEITQMCVEEEPQPIKSSDVPDNVPVEDAKMDCSEDLLNTSIVEDILDVPRAEKAQTADMPIIDEDETEEKDLTIQQKEKTTECMTAKEDDNEKKENMPVKVDEEEQKDAAIESNVDSLRVLAKKEEDTEPEQIVLTKEEERENDYEIEEVLSLNNTDVQQVPPLEDNAHANKSEVPNLETAENLNNDENIENMLEKPLKLEKSGNIETEESMETDQLEKTEGNVMNTNEQLGGEKFEAIQESKYDILDIKKAVETESGADTEETIEESKGVNVQQNEVIDSCNNIPKEKITHSNEEVINSVDEAVEQQQEEQMEFTMIESGGEVTEEKQVEKIEDAVMTEIALDNAVDRISQEKVESAAELSSIVEQTDDCQMQSVLSEMSAEPDIDLIPSGLLDNFDMKRQIEQEEMPTISNVDQLMKEAMSVDENKILVTDQVKVQEIVDEQFHISEAVESLDENKILRTVKDKVEKLVSEQLQTSEAVDTMEGNKVPLTVKGKVEKLIEEQLQRREAVDTMDENTVSITVKDKVEKLVAEKLQTSEVAHGVKENKVLITVQDKGEPLAEELQTTSEPLVALDESNVLITDQDKVQNLVKEHLQISETVDIVNENKVLITDQDKVGKLVEEQLQISESVDPLDENKVLITDQDKVEILIEGQLQISEGEDTVDENKIVTYNEDKHKNLVEGQLDVELRELESFESAEEMKSEDNIISDLQMPVAETTPSEDISTVVGSIEDLPNVAADEISFITENLEMPSRSLAEDLDLLVQNAVDEEPVAPALSPVECITSFQQKIVQDDVEMPSSSTIDALKTLEEDVIANTMLPLAMEDVPDLEVLNAISSLNDNKSNLMPEMAQSVNNDALLTSSTLEEPSEGDVSFETGIETPLPTVDEIFAEQSEEQTELQDDNLETLLAVASLQNVDYNMPSVEDFPADESIPLVEPIPDFVPEGAVSQVEDFPAFIPTEESSLKIQDAKIESLFEETESPMEESTSKVEKADTGESEDVTQSQDDKLKEPLIIDIDETEKEEVYCPKITIKPIKPAEDEEVVTSASGELDEKEGIKGSLKMTITKQSDNTHSILKIYDPNNDVTQNQDNQSCQPEPTVPKLIIKPIVQPSEQPQSPKISTRSSKQVFSPSSSGNQRSASPRITIKPIPKPDNVESVVPLKITIKPVLKPDDSHRQKHSPKLTIKPILKPEEGGSPEPKVHSPRVTIKPIVKPVEEIEHILSPRITIKPIVKPDTVTESPSTPRVTIKPVLKPQEKDRGTEATEQTEKSSPKITIKPIVKPPEPELALEDFDESIKGRIVLKINKGTIPSSSKELRKREVPLEEEKSEKLAKIKLKFSKGGGHPHIVQNKASKRPGEQLDHERPKRQRIDPDMLPGVTITPIGPPHSKLKEMLSKSGISNEKVVTIEDDEDDDDVTIVEETSKPSPIVISEESNQDSMTVTMDESDPISEIPVFEITPDSVKTLNPQPVPPVVEVPVTLPAPRKRGRPRKVPLQVREDFKDPKEEEPKPVVVESTRPKRSCRGQSVRTTLGIKPRKPRGPGRGRGSKRGMGTRSTPTPPETPQKPAKEPKLSGAKLKQLKEDLLLLSDKTEVKPIEILDDGFHKSPSHSLLAPPQSDNSTTDRADIVMYEEETRMSAETSSRAQTPAKQVVTSIPTVDLIEESQSSVQSSATTESVKVRKGPRLEVHQEPEGAVISADQLAEYYWSGGGPFMLQEQVAQFLGIKSFKRKYPNIPRRVVDMQERDFIRESGLAGEAMCDLGLTAVNSTDILDIMYSDFQDKYEEYCKHQRDRQAKDLTNKQKALSLAASQEKTKMDITQQAVQSAASWNANFNKTRRDQRKACMDLQTLTVHFPKGKMKQINKPKIGYYPVALVPGQFTDYYGEFTPTEINNLPFNTLCYDPIIKAGSQEMECDSQTDGSGSESDSSSSDSDSSYSGSSDGEDCTLCKPTPKRIAAAQ